MLHLSNLLIYLKCIMYLSNIVKDLLDNREKSDKKDLSNNSVISYLIKRRVTIYNILLIILTLLNS